MGVERAVTRWHLQHQTITNEIAALEAKLPRQYWLDINALLVPFGKHICTPVAPKCSTCPMLDMCQQRNVSNSR